MDYISTSQYWWLGEYTYLSASVRYCIVDTSACINNRQRLHSLDYCWKLSVYNTKPVNSQWQKHEFHLVKTWLERWSMCTCPLCFANQWISQDILSLSSQSECMKTILIPYNVTIFNVTEWLLFFPLFKLTFPLSCKYIKWMFTF